MGKASIFDNIREWIGGVAFAIFLWSARMTQDEYIDELTRDAQLRIGADDAGQPCPSCSGSRVIQKGDTKVLCPDCTVTGQC